MKHRSIWIALGAGLAFAAGCAGEQKPKSSWNDPFLQGDFAQGAAKKKKGLLDDDEAASPNDLAMDRQVGFIDNADVEDTIMRDWPRVRACYDRAGAAVKYAAGRVMMHFMLTGNGEVARITVTESRLGNYDVERCLVETCQSLKFPPPKGRRPTTFEYAVEFRSTGEMDVSEWSDARTDKEIAQLLPQLADCGSLATQGVTATIYVEPGGKIGSVGLAGAAHVNETAGECAVNAIRNWRLSIAMNNRVLRSGFVIPPEIPTVAASSKRAGPSGGARRRSR